MLSFLQIAAAIKAHKLLLAKKKLPNFEQQYPGLTSVLAQLEGNLNLSKPDWRKMKLELTDIQHKDSRKMAQLWLTRARSGKHQNISNYFYKM